MQNASWQRGSDRLGTDVNLEFAEDAAHWSFPVTSVIESEAAVFLHQAGRALAVSFRRRTASFPDEYSDRL